MSAESLGTTAWTRLLALMARMASPVILASLTQTLMGLVDTLMIGRLGTAAIAAVGIATLLFSTLATGLRSLDVAVQVITARRDGAGRCAEVGAVLGTGLALVLAAGAAATLACWRWPALGMRLVSPDPEVVALGAAYFQVRGLGLLPFVCYFLVRACFDGLGQTRIGMLTGVGMNVLNVVLNWVLIFGHFGAPALGVRGAALASVLASAVAAGAILAVALRPALRRRYRLLARGSVRRDLILPLLRIGWPPALQATGLIGGLVLFTMILGQVSTVAVAAGNIVLRIAALTLMAAVGVGVVVQTLVSRSLGARDLRGAWRSGLAGLVLAGGLMAAVGLPMLLWPDALLATFAVEPPVLAAGRQILRLTAFVQMAAAVSLAFAGALRGAGAMQRVLLVDLATGVLCLLPLAWLFAVTAGGGLLGAWWALVAWLLVHAAWMTRLFFAKRWLSTRI
ncbi:MAG: MATE family efflux transporter [Candidatus Krumholzibacteria bacterium]|nr:MATE family efflux transporter [Candidatus Krumholzibacteria bacterium]